ncbi:hypothetical protein U27_01146 [Candidatus Vecturithrix granuli]|uniref:Uncharacterized protein n=1 Tax=Vecturithrix granuli TaxID=1499967 RepID=A0A081C9J2_VECG1|nr:hypothetical protein U27_01146 [Candidatus Vecturithrix granuli]
MNFRQLLAEYLELKTRGIKDSNMERELVARHDKYFMRLGKMRSASLFGYHGSKNDRQEFRTCIKGLAYEAFMSFETEDMILPKSGKSLFQRLIDESYTSAQIERILYYGGYKMRGRRCECGWRHKSVDAIVFVFY